jgi:hypothetical protein
MNRDIRAALLAALREIYDGHWTRHVGVDGGRTLDWSGKLGLLAGCTAAIDSHHGVMSVMGERFLLHRLPEIDPPQQARRALANADKTVTMRAELSSVVKGLFNTILFPETLPAVDEVEIGGLVALASLVSRARSAVERDAHTREIELILDPEAPARIVQALLRLYCGLIVIGCDRETSWAVVHKTGLDSIPKQRRSVFDMLVKATDWVTTKSIAEALGYPTITARRALEDLTVHGVADRESDGQGTADRWQLTAWAVEQLQASQIRNVSRGERAA